MPKFNIDAQTLRTYLRTLEGMYSKDKSRSHLCALHLRDMGDDSRAKLRFEACNGHTAAAITPERLVIRDFEREGFFSKRTQYSAKLRDGVLYKADTLKPLTKALTKKVQGLVEWNSDGHVVLPTGDSFMLTVVSQDFPPLDNVLPADRDTTCERYVQSFNPVYLMDVGKAGKEFLGDTAGRSHGLNVDLGPGEFDGSTFLTANELGTLRMVVMPVRCGRYGAEESPNNWRAAPREVEKPVELPSDFHDSLTFEGIMAAAELDDHRGFCIDCGAEAMQVEPDARNYECQSCSAKNVFGAPELILMTEAVQ